MPDPDTNAPEGTPLPETFAGDEALASFKTVEELADGYKTTLGKASSIGSIETIPEELRNDPNIKKYKDISELAKGHLETVKLIGRKGVLIPGENATDEEKAKFLEAIGRPKTADEYKFTPIEKLHPEVQVTPESEKAFRDEAHKLGFTNAQVDGLNSWYLNNISNALIKRDEAMVKQKEEAAKKLNTEWGADYDNNLNLAQRLINKFGGKEAMEAFKKAGDLGNNPAIARLLVNVAKKMTEDTVMKGEFNELLGTAQEAQRKIESMNKEIMTTDPSDSKYSKLLEERMKLYQIAYPEGVEA